MNNHRAHFRLILVVVLIKSVFFHVFFKQCRIPGCAGQVEARDNEEGGKTFSGPPKPIVARARVADATSHLTLTHTVHKMTEILTGWDAGGLLCKNIPVLRQMCPRGRVGKIALQMLSVTI